MSVMRSETKIAFKESEKLFNSPDYNQNWVCGDVTRNSNMATKATHTTLISSELFLGPKSSLFVTRPCTEYD